MKKRFNYIILIFAVSFSVLSCSEWTEPELAMHTDLVTNPKDDAYYANLRAYRNSEHEITMGYFQGWAGPSSSYKYSLMGLPDSLDIVSMWAAGFNYNELQMADMKEAQEKKGIKCLLVFIMHSLGTACTPSWVTSASVDNPATIYNPATGNNEEYTDPQQARRAYWGMDPNDGVNNTPAMDELAIKAVECYADSLCVIIDRLGLDGFDWDFEPGYAGSGDIVGGSNIITTQQAHDRSLAFARRMREGLVDKIFIIDGVPQDLAAPEACIYFDYFAHQAYGSGGTSLSETAMDTRYNYTVRAFSPYMEEEEIAKRTILLETFEGAYTHDGKTYCGFENWRLRDGSLSGYERGSIEGMARWKPIVDGKYVRKGGIGVYQMQNDYAPGGWGNYTYPMLRNCIQIMNPAVN